VPTYTYHCRSCGGEFEVRQRISEPPLRKCARNGCHGPVDRVIRSVGVIFKGSGFHVNDYPDSKGHKRGDGAKKDAPPTDSSPGSTTETKPEGKPGSETDSKKDHKPATKDAKV